MMRDMRQRPGAVRRKRSTAARVAESVLWVVAALSLGTVIVVQADAFFYQRGARATVASTTETAATVVPARVPPGTPIARLSIPRLDVDVVVAEGSSPGVLRRAVGRLPDSARPGEPGSVVLAGHRDTFFRPLANVREGDLIVLDSGSRRRNYRVEWTRIVGPADVGVLSSGRTRTLTLVTCYPFQYVGNAPLRFVVRAREHAS